MSSGTIAWAPHGHASRSEGKVGEEVVAVIRKLKNHTHSNSGIYAVEVAGEELRDRFRGIAEARAAGQRVWEAR